MRMKNEISLSPRSRNIIIITLVLLVILRLLMMAHVPLTDTTESRYAEIARKMVETNNWITPQYDYGIPFWAKPPLSTWASALGIKCFGVNQFAVRFFIFLVALGMGWLTFHWVKTVRSRSYAWLAVLVLASTTSFFISSGMVMTDLIMIAGTTLCMVSFWNAFHVDRHRKIYGYLFFVGLAIGLLAKGPIAVVLTGIPLFLWLIWNGGWKDFFLKLPWISGTILMLALAIPWYFLAERATPGFINYFIIGEHFSRFVVSGWEGDLYGNAHYEPLGTIWIYWFLTTLPWSPLIVFCGFKVLFRKIKLAKEEKPWISYLVCWVLAPLLFFSLAKNIIPSYTLSGAVAGAVLTVELWKMAMQANQKRDNLVLGSGLALALIIFSVAYVLFSFIPSKSPKFSAAVVVDKIRARSHEENPTIYFYGDRRSYSSEFYTQGKVVRIENLTQLRNIMNTNGNSFITFSNRDFRDLPESISDSFVVIDRNKYKVITLSRGGLISQYE